MKLKDLSLPLRYTLSQSVRVTQFLSQMVLGNMAFGRTAPEEIRRALPPLGSVVDEMRSLFAKDLANIQAGLYREPSEFGTGPVGDFSLKSLQTFVDLFRVERRRSKKLVNQFSKDIPMEEYPKYFAQTFHYQTDGYLSEASAKLYDHQVELVFGGSAQAMRRLALVPLYHELQSRKMKQLATPLKLLDVACGTGLFLKSIKDNYPEVRVTGLDLSPWYLKTARETLSAFEHADFIEGNAESMTFRDSQFDVVTSIFLFHELPRRVRKKVLSEIHRVLKPGGLVILEDSIQTGDRPYLNASLENFPYLYHEPYYLDYVGQDFRALFRELGFELESTDLAFFSKIWVLRKTEPA